ncbi:hypothetical protein C1X59_21480 [Pseudomonas sp. FW215-R2]|nr:hypothetical protein C1X59_21480 [Pseudomonas sp. FW215-R2]PMX07150.1 hypothetical protein C1X60_21720 [Pseudomonas sp. FW215-L1]PMX21191.1 hypothetical protein C1X57_18575 [Pseudomonas sp. FW215-E1]PNA28071.1 hypothetical protein C1X58_18245 [Pseudomonas sp. FW215-R4]
MIAGPVGRLSGGIDSGWERSDRLAKPNTSRGGAAKQTVGDAPGSIPERRNPEPQRGAVRQGRDLLVTFGAFAKSDPP